MNVYWRVLLASGAFASLLACSHAPAPVGESLVVRKPASGLHTQAADGRVAVEAGRKNVGNGQQHVVEKGDTLYSIAFRYSMDFRTLAALNGIGEPYTIYPGQVLTIKSRGLPVTPKPKPGAGSATAAVEDAPKASAPVKSAATTVVVSKPALPAAEPSRPDAAKPAPVATVISGSASVTATPAPTRVVAGGTWRWPVQGKLIGSFTTGGVGPKGIAIGGKTGDPVYAARDGRVVYTGTGLVGYGQLVIVKHDDVYLSAYAHNSKVLVKEGDSVKAGDTIAEMGSTGADRTKLHFEVRRNGDPIDPLSVLPPL